MAEHSIARPTLGAVMRAIYGGCDGLIELRALNPPAAFFASLRDGRGLGAFLDGHSEQDLYLGVATRLDDTSGAKANCLQLPALFVDIDFKSAMEADARQRLADFVLPASLIIHSGAGLHVYWLLREPIDLQHVGELKQAEALLRRLAAAVGGDMAAAEAARILRVPRSRNYKYDPPRDVVSEHFTPDTRFNLSDFDDVLPADPAGDDSCSTRSTPFALPRDAAPGTRNFTVYRFGRSLKAKKMPATAVLAAMKSYNGSLSEPLPDDEVARTFDNVMRQPDRKLSRAPDDPPPPPPPEPRGAEQTPPGEPGDLARLLDEGSRFSRRFVVLSEAQAHTLALWIVHTHVIDAAECTPYLHVTAATKRAGKTLALEVLECVVRRPWLTGRTTTAALVRKIDAERPTLLLDEADQALTEKSDYAKALVGVLNSGFRPSGKVSLCVGEGSQQDVVDLKTYGAKAIAGIGELPGTIADRAIVIKLRRKIASEKVERARQRAVKAAAKPLRDALERWAVGATPQLQGAEPTLPEALNDRQQDIWECLFAIADLAGGDWPARARHAALALADVAEDSDIAIELLADIREVVDAVTEDGVVVSTRLLKRLVRLKDRPWAMWSHGREMNGHALSRMLRGFDVIADRHYVGSKRFRGYRQDALIDAFARYLPSKVSQCPNPNENGGESSKTKCPMDTPWDTSKSEENPIDMGGWDTGTLRALKVRARAPAEPTAAPCDVAFEPDPEALEQLRDDLVASGLVSPGTPLVEVPTEPWTPVRPEDFDPADADLPDEQQEYRARTRARARAMAARPAADEPSAGTPVEADEEGNDEQQLY